jgi:hypothetical protein
MLSILLIANYFLRKALTLMNYQGFGMLFSAFLLSALIASVILLFIVLTKNERKLIQKYFFGAFVR